MLRKVLSISLAFVLVAMVFGACAAPAPAQNDPAPAPAQNDPPGPAPAAAATPAASVDKEVAKAKGFGLDDIPEIQNKAPIHIMVEASGSGDTIVGFLEKFAQKTGVPVTHEMIAMASAYGKQLNELQARTGAYDAVMVETTWTNEWKDYLVPLGDLAELYDPAGRAGLEADLVNYDPGLLRCASTANGTLMGLPYYSYPLIQYIREDVWNDPTEQAAFQAKYGYPLAVGTTFEQIRDQAEFFTRKAGETLKGEVLDKNIYGTALMGGRFTHVQDEIETLLWGQGGNFATPTRDASGNITEWVFTKHDREIMIKACQQYVELMKFASPGSENAFWDFTGSEFAAGNIMFMFAQYNGLWSWMVNDLKANVPGGTVVAAPVPGMRPYTGGFFFGSVKESKNLEAVYWLSRYLASYEAQYEMPLAGGWPISRTDVLVDAQANLEPDVYHTAFGYGVAQRETALVQLEDINDYIHFNSDAAGKLYDLMTDLFHENATGVRSPEETANEWGRRFAEIQTTYGSVPGRVEE